MVLVARRASVPSGPSDYRKKDSLCAAAGVKIGWYVTTAGQNERAAVSMMRMCATNWGSGV